jgi:hypothetical protein
MSDVLKSEVPLGAKVLIGESGWLYLDNDKNRSVDQYVGKYPLPTKAHAAWQNSLESLTAMSASSDFRHVHVFAPSKEVVYEEYYPFKGMRAGERPVETVIKLAVPGANILYPIDSLRSARGVRETYDKGDTHWNAFGAFIATKDILKFAFPDADLLDERLYSFQSKPRDGDLQNKIPGLSAIDRITVSYLGSPAHKIYDNGVSNRGCITVHSNPEAPRSTVILFGDSFGWNIIPFLSHVFQRVVSVHCTSAEKHIIEHERPELVITEAVDRFAVEGPYRIDNFNIVDVIKKKLIKETPEKRRTITAINEAFLEKNIEPFYTSIASRSLAV